MAQDTPPADNADPHVEALTGVLLPLLSALDGLQFAQRHLYPPMLGQLVARVQDLEAPLRDGLAAFQALDWPEHIHTSPMRMSSRVITSEPEIVIW